MTSALRRAWPGFATELRTEFPRTVNLTITVPNISMLTSLSGNFASKDEPVSQAIGECTRTPIHPRPSVAYVVADLEGSTGVLGDAYTRPGTREWCLARRAVTEDLNAVVEGLVRAGAEKIIVKDFHGNGYNILPELLNRNARLVRGYYLRPVLGFGDLQDASVALYVGMHASSGNKAGFMPHTLTRRIKALRVNGESIAEVQLFASVLAEFGIAACFLSGCPVACDEASKAMPWIQTCEVPKPMNITQGAKPPDYLKIREALARTASAAFAADKSRAYRLTAPYHCEIEFAGERNAIRASHWGMERSGNIVALDCDSVITLYEAVIRAAYFSATTWFLAKSLNPIHRWWCATSSAVSYHLRCGSRRATWHTE
jgi:D-amino peptidase